MRRLIFIGLLVLTTALGCASSKPIDELANVTAANVSIVGSSLSHFVEDANLLAEDRARALQNLSNQLDRSHRQLVEDLIILKRIKADAPFRELEVLVEQSQEVHSIKHRERSDALIKEILNSYTSLQVPSDTLAEMAETLATLGEQRNTREQIKFFATFSNQVKEDIDRSIEQHDLSNDSARRILDETTVAHRRLLLDSPVDN